MTTRDSSVGEALFFKPIMVERVWGGNRLGALFGKEQPSDKIIGESWELSDRPEEQSIVEGGRFDGRSLNEVMLEHPEALLGPVLAERQWSRFPLLIKYVDAGKPLSVQVHPDDEGAVKLGIKDRGKCECWYIVSAEPGSSIVRGLKAGVTRATFEQAIKDGAVESQLHSFEPKAGDVVSIPPGMLHAIGAGIVISEIQQSSDVTFRVYDYGRVGLDGKPRQLHIQESLDCIQFDGVYKDFFQGDMAQETAIGIKNEKNGVTITSFLSGKYFDLDSISVPQGAHAVVPVKSATCAVLCCVKGKGRLGDRVIQAGMTVLLPADLASDAANLSAADHASEDLVCLISTPTPEA